MYLIGELEGKEDTRPSLSRPERNQEQTKAQQVFPVATVSQ
jgi:hypothetical protein